MDGFAEWVADGEMSVLAGRRIFHRRFGPEDGPAVTLIHGYPTSSHDWRPVLSPLMESGLRVTVLDLLGFGASEKPLGHRYSLSEQASIVEALWGRLGIGLTALVSHDYGVSVAQELLARDPGRITRAAFLNGGLYPDLHRPIPIQSLMHGPAGVVLGPLASERMYRRSLNQILGRPLSDDDLHQMWLATSGQGAAGSSIACCATSTIVVTVLSAGATPSRAIQGRSPSSGAPPIRSAGPTSSLGCVSDFPVRRSGSSTSRRRPATTPSWRTRRPSPPR